MPFAKAEDGFRIYDEVHGRPEVWNRTVLEFLARRDRRSLG